MFHDNKYESKRFASVGVIGAGQFGTAVAHVLSQKVDIIGLYSNSEEIAYSINAKHINHKFMPELALANNVRAFTSLERSCQHDLIFLCVRSCSFIQTCNQLKKHVSKDIPVVICTKGVNPINCSLLDETVSSILDTKNINILGGPSFAKEIACDKTTFVSLGSKNIALAESIANELSTKNFIMRPIKDTIGLQLFGALKNVVAIGSGFIHGSGYGDCLKSCFINAATNEIIKLVRAAGGMSGVLLEPGGFADLCMTSFINKSRNFMLGEEIAKSIVKVPLSQTIDQFNLEGATTARSIPMIEKKYGISAPCLSMIYRLLYTTYDNKEIEHALISTIQCSI